MIVAVFAQENREVGPPLGDDEAWPSAHRSWILRPALPGCTDDAAAPAAEVAEVNQAGDLA